MRELSLPLVFVCLIFGAVIQAFEVENAQQLVGLFQGGKGGVLELDIELVQDIDFSGFNSPLPLGASSDGNCISYSGVFEGNNHSIRNLKMDNTNELEFNHSGLFCKIKDATVQNLIIDSSCSFTGNWSGGLSVTATGSLNIINVTNNAIMNGQQYVGGLIGYIQNEPNTSFHNKKATIEIKDCQCQESFNQGNSAEVVGGMIGFIHGTTNLTLKIENSNTGGSIVVKNPNQVKSFMSVGGFIGLLANNSNFTVSFSNCHNKYAITTMNVQKVGGFIGSVLNNKNIINGTNITLTDCENHKQIKSTNGSNVGGFIGFIFNILRVEAKDCENNGAIIIDNKWENIAVGGIIGFFTNDANVVIDPIIKFTNVNNWESVTVKENPFTATVGGLIGSIHEIDGYLNNTSINIQSCSNHGEIKVAGAKNDAQIGGLIGNMTKNGYFNVEIKHCSNKAKISALPSQITCIVGGLIGWVSRNGRSNLTIAGCHNDETLTASGSHNDVGGIVGSVSRNRLMSITFENNTNTGNACLQYQNQDTNTGGIVGGVEENPSMEMTLNFVRNKGTMSTCSQHGGNSGGLVGRLDLVNDGSDFTFSISNSVNDGDVKNSDQKSSSCGLFCVSSESFLDDRTVEVKNSINRGFVHGNTSYGIASKVTNAENVVSLGDVSGKYSSNPFFECDENKVNGCYVLEKYSSNITRGCTYFSDDNGQYITTDGEEVHDELNERAMNKQYGKVWNESLHIIDGVEIKLIQLSDKPFVLVSGTTAFTFKNFSVITDNFNNTKHIVKLFENGTKDKEIEDSFEFNETMTISLCHKVTFQHDFEGHIFVEDNTCLNTTAPKALNTSWGEISVKNGPKDYKNLNITSDVNLTVNVFCHLLNKGTCGNFTVCMDIGSCRKKSVAILIIFTIAFEVCGFLGALIYVVVTIISPCERHKCINSFHYDPLPVFGPNHQKVSCYGSLESGDDEKNHLLSVSGDWGESHGFSVSRDEEGKLVLFVSGSQQDRLGTGRFGAAFKKQLVDDEGNQHTYAVKVIPVINRFEASAVKKEVRKMEQLNTQFVAEVFGCKYFKKHVAITMEYFPSGSLRGMLPNKLPPNARVPMLLDIANAMEYLHSVGKVHYHLKPENVLVCSVDLRHRPMCKFVSFFSNIIKGKYGVNSSQ